MSNYIQTTWNTGDLITKEKLNKLENGLAEITVDNLGGVKKSGDTMTGALHSTHVISYGVDNYPRFIFNLQDESKPAGWLLMNTDTRGMSFRMYMSDGVHYDSYALPVPSNLSRTTDVGYSILTTKSAVTVAQGGTGATTAPVALTNLGAVAKSGDTMTGNLQAPRLYVYASDYPSVRFLSESGSSTTLCNIFAIANTRQLRFSETPTDQTGSSPKLETYVLPEPSTGLTSNAIYTILTSKSAVTIAQGGTGATSASAALTNLGALATTGGTLTGALYLNATNGYPTLGFTRPNEKRGALIQPTVTNDAVTHFSFCQYNSNATFYENYVLPNTSTTLSATATYNILTSKSAVTIAQGGTGVTSQGASHAALAVAGGYCDYTNATSFTFTLPNLSDAHYHHAIVFGGDTTTLYCYLMFINVQKAVSFYPLYTASTVRTLTGSVSGNTLTITVNATSYGGIRLIWFNDTATGT